MVTLKPAIRQQVRENARPDPARPAARPGAQPYRHIHPPGCAVPSQGSPGLITVAGLRRRFCSPACRQAAYRRRNQPVAREVPLPGRRSRLQGTIYECAECETRYLAEQWCPECSRPCQRLGAGGTCPRCEEMITAPAPSTQTC